MNLKVEIEQLLFLPGTSNKMLMVSWMWEETLCGLWTEGNVRQKIAHNSQYTVI